MDTSGSNGPRGSTRPAAEIDLRETSGLAGKTLHGRYRLRSFVGSDFAGTLYLAEEQPGGKKVGLKVLARGFSLKSEAFLEIEHPNVVRILKRLEPYEGLIPLLVEVPEGRRLRAILSKHRRLPPGLAVAAITQLLSALHAVHFRELAAGNLDLDSLYLSRDPLGDPALGICNLGVADPRKLPDKPFYAAPEVVRGDGAPDRRSDIWAAGVILFEMLFGRRPFGGKDLDEIAGNILLNDPVFPAGFNDLPPELIAVVRKALQKDPEQRYHNATTMTGDLLPIQEQLDDTVDEAAIAALLEPAPGKISVDTREMPAYQSEALKKKTQVGRPAALRASVISRLAEGQTKKTLGPVARPVKPAPSPESALKAAPPPLPVPPKAPAPAPMPEAEKPPPVAAEPAPPQAPEPPAVKAPTPSVPAASVIELPEPSAVEAPPPLPWEESISGIDIAFSDPPAGAPEVPMELAAPPAPAAVPVRPPRRWKTVAAIAGGAVAALLLAGVYVAFFSGSGAPPAPAPPAPAPPPAASAVRTAPPAPPPAPKAPEPPPGPALPDDAGTETAKVAQAVQAPRPEPPVVPPPPAPSVPEDTVTITLNGVLPGAQVTVNRARVGNPFQLPRGQEAVALAVHVEGYWTFSKMLVPNQDRTVEIVMEKKLTDAAGKPRRSGRNREGADKGTPERSYGKLASNPFGE